MTNKQAIENFLNDTRLAIIAKINRATGETGRSLRVTAGKDFGYLVGPAYIDTLERGRRPTRPGAQKGAITLRESIMIWINARGIQPRPGQTRESLAFAIAKTIHEKGSKLYREKRVSGVLSETITEDRFTELLDDLAQVNLIEVGSKVMEDFRLNLSKQ